MKVAISVNKVYSVSLDIEVQLPQFLDACRDLIDADTAQLMAGVWSHCKSLQNSLMLGFRSARFGAKLLGCFLVSCVKPGCSRVFAFVGGAHCAAASIRDAIHASMAFEGHATDFSDSLTPLGNLPCFWSVYKALRFRPVRSKTG